MNDKKKKAVSAQDSIPIERVWPDGIIRHRAGYYTKSIIFDDINYQLCQDEDKKILFDGWCGFLNYFDPSVSLELTFVNMPHYGAEVDYTLKHTDGDGDFALMAKEYEDYILKQAGRGSRGLSKKKYITLGVESDGIADARERLEKITADVLQNLRTLGVKASPLSGEERLALLYSVFNGKKESDFIYPTDDGHVTGMNVKDYIAPSSFDFGRARSYSCGDRYGASAFLQIIAPELEDRLLAGFLDTEYPLVLSIHMRSIDQSKAVRNIKRKITDLQKMKIDEQKKAVRSGYDMDIIPSDLATYGSEAEKLLAELQNRNERLFLFTLVMSSLTETKEETEKKAMYSLESLAGQNNCRLIRLDYRQEEGFFSSLPLGLNLIGNERTMTSSASAVFIPFTTEELFDPSDGSLYCGTNALSGNVIMVDRKKLKNPNGLILGTPGSGKSFAAKREIANVFLATDDDVIICDPESEYSSLISSLGGQIVRISPTSGDYINPMDLTADYSDDEDPLALKSDFILSLCELIIGGKEGLKPVEKTVIDRAVRLVYRPYLENPIPENMPLLGDLYETLLSQDEKEAKYIATALEIYVKGSLNVFNHRTNVDTGNRAVVYDIKELGKQLKKIGMLIVEDQVWNRVTGNRERGKSTRYYIDEMHLLLKEEQTAQYTVEIWKRFRKWGGIPTGITQNVKDLLSSREVENIFENSDYIYMLNQAAGDRTILAKQLGISPTELSYVTHSGEGEGLLFYGNTILPFKDRFPVDTRLYRVMTTKLSEKTKGNL